MYGCTIGLFLLCVHQGTTTCISVVSTLAPLGASFPQIIVPALPTRGTTVLVPVTLESSSKYALCVLSFIKYDIHEIHHSFFFSILFIFQERGREGERKGEKHQCVVASHVPPTGDLACNPGLCPDWESNWQPFALQSGAQSTEPHQPGQEFIHFTCCIWFLTIVA